MCDEYTWQQKKNTKKHTQKKKNSIATVLTLGDKVVLYCTKAANRQIDTVSILASKMQKKHWNKDAQLKV